MSIYVLQKSSIERINIQYLPPTNYAEYLYPQNHQQSHFLLIFLQTNSFEDIFVMKKMNENISFFKKKMSTRRK